jgi:hypothetical protein
MVARNGSCALRGLTGIERRWNQLEVQPCLEHQRTVLAESEAMF